MYTKLFCMNFCGLYIEERQPLNNLDIKAKKVKKHLTKIFVLLHNVNTIFMKNDVEIVSKRL